MKTIIRIICLGIILSIFMIAGIASCKSGGEGKSSKARKQDSIVLLSSNVNGVGKSIEVEMIKGKAHNHPTFAIWIEDTAGKYLQTLYVTKAISQGFFKHGTNSAGEWKPGEVRRPAALPYWAQKRGIKNEYRSFEPTLKTTAPDTHSGATPEGSFKLKTQTDNASHGKVKLLMEINQPWDWNEFWTNSMYPEDAEYKTSCQPAIVYEAKIDLNAQGMKAELKPVGHSHYSGKTGELFTDISTITTALHIAEHITVTIK